MRGVEATLRFGAAGSTIAESADEFRDVLKNKFGKDWVDYRQAAGKLVQVMNLFTSMEEALHYVSADNKCVDVGKAAIVSSIVALDAASVAHHSGRSR
jgi:hypothetical protein